MSDMLYQESLGLGLGLGLGLYLHINCSLYRKSFARLINAAAELYKLRGLQPSTGSCSVYCQVDKQ